MAIKERKLRKKKCRSCAEKFQPSNTFHNTCSPKCAILEVRKQQAKKDKAALAQEKKRDKAQRAENKAQKEAIRSRASHLEITQKAVNTYIRERDRGKPCISCDKPDVGVRNASHYKSVGSNSYLRFHLWNIHASCYKCNKKLSGNIGEYRIRLINLIGVEKVEWLENAPRLKRMEIDYIIRVREVFREKTKRLKKRRAVCGDRWLETGSPFI